MPRLYRRVCPIQSTATQKRVAEMQRDGKDVSPIGKVMRQLSPAIEAGQAAETEKIVAEALKLLGERDE